MSTKTFDVIVEIPRGSRNKYEYNHQTGKIHFDRMLYPSMVYPADYGFFPDTLALDGDPLDFLLLLTEPTFPGCVVEVKPLGVLIMSDDKGQDEKVICVPVSDPNWSHLENLEDVGKHLIAEIENFFQTYKILEKKEVNIEGWAGKEKALQIIEECTKRYKH